MLARSRFRTRARGPGAGSGSGGGGSLTALAQILALEPTALWWPTEGSGWQGRTGGTLSAVGSPVGILPDLSQLGGATLDEWLEAPTTPEALSYPGNPYNDTTGFVPAAGTGSITVTGGALVYTDVPSTYGVFETTNSQYTNGTHYRVSVTISALTLGQFRLRIKGGALAVAPGSVGTHTLIVQAGSGSSGLDVLALGTVSGSITAMSVRELPGIHAIAPTDAARPLLGRVPVTGRRNLLTYTEQFDNVAGWASAVAGTGAAPVVTANAGTDPLGGTTADRLQTSRLATSDRSLRQSTVANITFTNGVSYTVSFWAKSFSGSNQDLQFVANAYGALVQTVTVTSEWQRFVYSFTSGTTITNSSGAFRVGLMGGSSSALSSDALIWGAQLELGSTATAYQRVVTALDVTEAGVADAEYLLLDKVDDVLNATMPATTGKMVLATPEGTAVYGVNISAGSYDVGGRGGDYFPGTSLVGQTIGDFTDEEAASIAAIFKAAGGGDDYGGVTSFENFWRSWSELTSFPEIDTSSGTNFNLAWRNCTSLTTFPLLDVSSGTNFTLAWGGCVSLTSFPALDVSSGTTFSAAWFNCTSLTTFPAGMFDTVTATNFTNAFLNTNLSQTSIDNILTSINTAGTSGGTFGQSGGSAPSATGEAAIDALRGRGWTVTVTGGY